MRRIIMACAVGAISVMSAGMALAQDKPVPPASITAPAVAAPAATDPDYARKLELAQEMHKIRPIKTQVQEVVDQASLSLTPMDRVKFQKMVEDAFDYAALEKISTTEMVALFTVPELQKMVDYFGSPEAKSTTQKLPKYQEKLQPAIIRMLDAAMLSARTGGNVVAPPNAPKNPTLTAPAAAPGMTYSSASEGMRSKVEDAPVANPELP